MILIIQELQVVGAECCGMKQVLSLVPANRRPLLLAFLLAGVLDTQIGGEKEKIIKNELKKKH
jgi:hypothetical protein